MDVSPTTASLYATGPDGWLQFLDGVDELGKTLQADIAKYKGLLQQYARFHFDQATYLSTPAFQPSSDILIQFQKSFDELEKVVQSHVLKVKNSLNEPVAVYNKA